MEKFKVSFEANNQQLKSIGTKHASDTYADIEATFVLGEKWTDMDSVSAVWWNDFTRVATVLDSQGKCIVPHEVLTRKGCVRVNLVGSIVEGDELITRLTSYSAEAVQVNEKIKLTGSETSELTPSQFEQFVTEVKADADRAETVRDEAEAARDVAVSAKDTAVNAVEGFEDIVDTATATAVQTIQGEGATQVTAIQTEGTTQVASVRTEGSTQVTAVQDKGDEVLDSIPADYTQLSQNVTDLKSELNDSDGVENAISSITQGIALTVDGTTASSTDYETTDYIPVNTDELYIVTNSAGGYPDTNGGVRSNLGGVAGYDTNKDFVVMLQDQLKGNATQGGRHISKNYVFKIPNGIKYIRATSAYKTSTPSYEKSPLILKKVINNGYNGIDHRVDEYTPNLANGTIPNPTNANAVCTADYIPCFAGSMVSCIVNKPYKTSTNYYTYGFTTYNTNKEIVRSENYTSITYGYSSVKVQNGECYIRFSVCEYSSDASAVANRVTDYTSYPIKVIVSGNKTVMFEAEEVDAKVIEAKAEISSLNEELYPKAVNFNIVSGKYISFYDGTEISGSDYDCSDYIAVNEGEHYIFTGVLGSNYDSASVPACVCYDTNKDYLCGIISQMSAIGMSGSRRLIKDYRFTIPTDAKYIRLTSAARNSASSDYPKSDIYLWKYESDSVWEKINKANSVLYNNEDMDGAVKASSKSNWLDSGYREYYTTKKYNFTMAIVSDLHGGYNNFARFAEYVNAHTDEIDIALSLGDIVLSEPKEGLFTYPNTVKIFDVPFLYVVGNHDTADTGLSGITQAQCRTKYFSEIVSKGFMSASDFGDTDKCYWHKDFSAYKIRLIALFEYGNSAEISTNAPNTYCRRWIDSAQLQWFADTLYSTPSDYSVIVLTHQMPWYPMTLDEGLFTQNPSALTDGTFLNTQDGRVVGDVVDAYINGTAISKTYSAVSGYGLEKTASVAKDFSSRGTGKYICNLCGHVHGSYIAHDSVYTNQLTIAVPSGSSSPYQQHYSDIPVSDNGRNIDRFYVVSFDTTNEAVNIVEIGAQDTLKMEKRNQIRVSY